VKQSVHFSSADETWATPQNLFDRLDAEFQFNLDPCALPKSAKCARYFTPDDDGLSQPWEGRVFMNPPYGRSIGLWTRRAVQMVRAGVSEVVVGLVPARTDTRWWNRDVLEAREIRFIEGRVRFGGAQHGAPFPSAVVIWENTRRFPTYRTMKGDEQ